MILYIMASILYITIRGGLMKTNLRRFRFERGELSQQQVANMVRISRQTVVSIEKGDYAPSVKLALLLAEKLETTVEQLFILEDNDRV
jgi:putative transcriptional regulator